MTTYTNQAKAVADALETLLVAEFTEFNVVNEEMFNPDYLSAQKYIRFYLTEDRLSEKFANGELREYEFQIAIYFNLDFMQEREDFAIYTDTAERLKQLIQNNNAYKPSDVYKWHGADINSIQYPVSIEEVEGIEGYNNVRGVYFGLIIWHSNFWS